jgi:hypothetical protein
MTEAAPKTVFIELRDVPVSELTPFPGNAKRGNVAMIKDSIQEHDQYRALVVRHTPDDRFVVLAGNHTLEAIKQLRRTTARCEIIACDDQTARKINLVDNRAADAGTYDDQALADILNALDGDFAGTGFDAHDLTSILTRMDEPLWAEQQAAEVAEVRERERAGEGQPEGATAAPARTLNRTVPLDAIFSMGRLCSITMAAYEMGFLPGIISTSLASARNLATRLPGVRLGFMDNEWHDYDHAAHLAAVAETKPKYATVRDIMTREQCEKAGVDFYSIPEVLDMAAEVAEHADNVIIIPKYDCLDQIPEEYVIGFSVPTSYGGTPMPASALRGRRVHLLGGSWNNQRSYLDILGDDVVSLDNNHLLRVCEWGDFTYADGSRGRLAGLDSRMPRTWQAAAILSLASIRDELNRHFGAQVGTDQDVVPDASGYSHDDDDDVQGE